MDVFCLLISYSTTIEEGLYIIIKKSKRDKKIFIMKEVITCRHCVTWHKTAVARVVVIKHNQCDNDDDFLSSLRSMVRCKVHIEDTFTPGMFQHARNKNYICFPKIAGRNYYYYHQTKTKGGNFVVRAVSGQSSWEGSMSPVNAGGCLRDVTWCQFPHKYIQTAIETKNGGGIEQTVFGEGGDGGTGPKTLSFLF